MTDELSAVNPFITVYKTAKERLDSVEDQEAEVRIILNPQLKLIMEIGADKRRENLPTSNEVVIIIPDEYDVVGTRRIILADRYGQGFSTINPNNAAYMALHYVLLFPYVEHGWHWALQLQNVERNQQTRLSQCAYYGFRLHIRSEEAKTLFFAQRLFQQYVVDAWVVCYQNKLLWLRTNQSRFRSDLYNGLADELIQADVNTEALGRRMILPSSFTSGDRFMQ